MSSGRGGILVASESTSDTLSGRKLRLRGRVVRRSGTKLHGLQFFLLDGRCEAEKMEAVEEGLFYCCFGVVNIARV